LDSIFCRSARKKRSGEQDKDKQIDGRGTNGGFSDQKLPFLKKKFFTDKNLQFR
jgi:hypothetical protein